MRCPVVEIAILVTLVIAVPGCTQEATPTPQEPSATLEEMEQLLADLSMRQHDAALALLAAKHRTPLEALRNLVLWHDSHRLSFRELIEIVVDGDVDPVEKLNELPALLDSVSEELGIAPIVAADVLLWISPSADEGWDGIRMHRRDNELALLAAKHGVRFDALQTLAQWYDSFEQYSQLPVVLDSVSAVLGIESAVAIDVLLWVELLDAAAQTN